MGATGIAERRVARRAWRSPWPVFGALLVGCWILLLRQHSSGHGGAHSIEPATALGMWLLMTVAMMAPTAVPVLGSLRGVLGSSSMRPWWAFLGGYLIVWIGFALVAASAQMGLVELDLVGPDGSSASVALTAGTLAAAGAYQFTSLKRRCLTDCVTPMTFFFSHWRDGVAGGARMGLRHGFSCLGCCWVLMLLAFVGGVANVWFMVLAAVVMVLEKLPAVSRYVTAALGVVLVVASVAVVLGAPLPGHRQPAPTSVPTAGKEAHGHVVAGG